MFKYIVSLILITGINALVTIKLLDEKNDSYYHEFFDMAEKSYFIGCAETLQKVGFPQEETIVICNAESQQYMEELNRAIKFN